MEKRFYVLLPSIGALVFLMNHTYDTHQTPDLELMGTALPAF